MSFGFSLGDFLTVASLAHDIYKEIYQVARGAPEEIQRLHGEIAMISMSIDLLIEEVKNPASTLMSSGESSVKRVVEVMKQAGKTLKDLQEFAQKHDFTKEKDKKKLRRVWDRTKWALQVKDIEALRKRVIYHNGSINLLLTAAGRQVWLLLEYFVANVPDSSSLERVELRGARMEKDVSEIKDMLSHSYSAPKLSGVETGALQIRLTGAFINEASRGRSLLSIGFDEWLRAGRWWLMKFQSGLYGDASPINSGDSKVGIPPQAYADLLKASFILVDIFPEHPQRRFWTSEYLKVELLAEEVKHELTMLDKRNVQKPSLSQVIRSDLRIWSEIPQSVDLTPSLRSEAEQPQPGSWQTREEIVLWQGFGWYTFKHTYAMATVQECIILILSSKDFRHNRFVGQTQQGVILMNIAIDLYLTYEDATDDENERELESFERCIGDEKNSEILVGRHTLKFPKQVDYQAFLVVLRSALFSRQLRAGHDILPCFSVLFAIATGQSVVIKRQWERYTQLCAEEINTAGASSVQIFVRDTVKAALSASSNLTKMVNNIAKSMSLAIPDLSSPNVTKSYQDWNDWHDWLYRILRAPTHLANLHWGTHFARLRIISPAPLGFSDHSPDVDNSGYSFLLSVTQSAAVRGDESMLKEALDNVNWEETATQFVLIPRWWNPTHIYYKFSAALDFQLEPLRFSCVINEIVHLEHEGNLRRLTLTSTMLRLALYYGRDAIVKVLIESGADLSMQINSLTPLHYAVILNSARMVSLLLDRGANPENYGGDYYGTTRKHHEKHDCIFFMTNPKTSLGNENHRLTSPLATSLQKGAFDIAKLLISKGASCKDIDLLGVNMKLFDHPEFFELLLENGAPPNGIPQHREISKKDSTPLKHAISLGPRYQEVIELLLEYGADAHVALDELVASFNIYDFIGPVLERESCQHRLSQSRWSYRVELVSSGEHERWVAEDAIDLARNLVAHGANMKVSPDAFQVAKGWGNLEMATFLLQQGWKEEDESQLFSAISWVSKLCDELYRVLHYFDTYDSNPNASDISSSSEDEQEDSASKSLGRKIEGLNKYEYPRDTHMRRLWENLESVFPFVQSLVADNKDLDLGGPMAFHIFLCFRTLKRILENGKILAALGVWEASYPRLVSSLYRSYKEVLEAQAAWYESLFLRNSS